MQSPRKEHLYKVLVIGDLGVGKTSVIRRYVHHSYSHNYRATIGVDFALKVLSWEDETVRLQLWDIAGQERFGNMTRVYYREAMGAFIVFDATRPSTFEAVAKWKEDLDSKLMLPNGRSVATVLLANKCDHGKDDFGSSNGPRMEQFCREHGFVGWFETSAKVGRNTTHVTVTPPTSQRRHPRHSDATHDNMNISEAANFLVKHIMATESDILKSVVPGTISPQLDSRAESGCSGCFKP
ncbi:hypothetical protein CRUP_000139 [Coryphaenoides rupestris]|nr:hypothetical protein CRUP_000139 [Coryphaenoides rupestris]